MIGKTISHYNVKTQLGEGGMGVVYEAEDTNLGRHVALKFLAPAMANDENLLQRFQREARAASSLNHPNICTIYDVGEYHGRPYISMELLEGQTLAGIIQGKPLPAKQILHIALQIAGALDEVHARGIVHRDIKPSNIFITQNRQAKIRPAGGRD